MAAEPRKNPMCVVKAAYPSAREVAKGLTYIAIWARTNEGGRVRDNLLGSGRTSAEAWRNTAERIKAADAN